uniref:Eukaryotic translation initiation factor 4E type 1B n=1 Tax=Castor canadensis TaxID=51338 RepID=A0A8C0ZWQ6_CASCN
AGRAEDGIPKWKEEKEKKEEKKEQEEAAMGESIGEEALSVPRTLRGKAHSENRREAKIELHPLQNRWALWFFKNDRSRAWQDNLHLVAKVDTVEDFWGTLLGDGIQPMWEDGRNKRGGRWLVSLAKQQRHIELDRLWLETLLCLIGESFEEHGREVCGAVINIRTKGDKIAVWTSEAENQAAVLHIGRVYKERLGLSMKTIIGYQAHADTASKSNSLAKNKFVV